MSILSARQQENIQYLSAHKMRASRGRGDARQAVLIQIRLARDTKAVDTYTR